MSEDNEVPDITREVNSIKDTIKESAQKITEYCSEEKNYGLIDKEFLEILNGLGKIGTLSSNPDKINGYTQALAGFVEHSRLDMRFGKECIKIGMNQVCGISFDIKKKGNKFEINLPKLDLNFIKVGT